MSVRSAAKAIIIEDDHVLLVRYRDERGVYYGLPGGGQDRHEALSETVVRECLEEINCRVIPQELLFVREFIGPRHAKLARHSDFHQVDHYFRCLLAPDSRPANGPGADVAQEGVAWLPLAQLHEYHITPAAIRPWLQRIDAPERPVYLGPVD